MPIAQFLFTETTPAAAGTAASSQAVQNAANYLAAGIAGPVDDYDSIDIIATFGGKTAAGASTGGTVDLYVQGSPDGGKTWVDAVHFTQAVANAAASTFKTTLSMLTQPASAAPVAVGLGLSPALAQSTAVQGVSFDRLRLVMVAGSGTTGGAPVSVIVAVHRVRIREIGGS